MVKCIKERSVHTHKHRVHNKHEEEQQEGGHKQVGSNGLAHHQTAGTLIDGNCFICQRGSSSQNITKKKNERRRP